MRRARGAMLPPVPVPRVRRRDLYQALRTGILGGMLASRARFRFTDVVRIKLLPRPAKGPIIER